MYSFPDLEPVCCSMFSSNYCFLTCIQVSQEVGQVVRYSHLSFSCITGQGIDLDYHGIEWFVLETKLEVVKQEMARVNIDILGINGLEWVNLIQMTIMFTTVGKNPLEKME